MSALFNYRWRQLPQFCCWFWEQLSRNRRAVEFPQPSWLWQRQQQCACQYTTAKHGFSLWMSLMSSWPSSLLRRLPREQEAKCWKRGTGNEQMFWLFGFIWRMALAENTHHIISVWHFLNKGFWSFVLRCHYFEICVCLERWKKVEAVKQQVKDLWSLNKSISF